MRLYYIAETGGRRCHVSSALGVDAERWNDAFRAVRNWRRRLRDRWGIPPSVALQPLRLLEPGDPASRERQGVACQSRREMGEILRSGLRLIEGEGRRGGVEVINVCLPRARQGGSEEVALGRILTRINTSVRADGRHAFLIFDAAREEAVTGLYRRLRVRNPIPSRFEAWEDGAPTRNIPIGSIIGGPAFRHAAEDQLLQLAGFVACALLLQEQDAGAGDQDPRIERAFAILDHALNQEASQRDPQGVVRR